MLTSTCVFKWRQVSHITHELDVEVIIESRGLQTKGDNSNRAYNTNISMQSLVKGRQVSQITHKEIVI
jgi:hypothetical protein